MDISLDRGFRFYIPIDNADSQMRDTEGIYWNRIALGWELGTKAKFLFVGGLTSNMTVVE